MIDARAELEQIIRERGEDYASLSRLLGRNSAYIQQFIRRGIPRKLDEDDRRTLARYLGVDEARLGAPALASQAPALPRKGLVMVPRLAVGASAGPGADAELEEKSGEIGFEEGWLRRLGAQPHRVSMISVQGESMAPTLFDGDDILVDRADASDRLRDGIYVLRRDGALMVKRLAFNPAARTCAIRSDNPAWPDWNDCDPADIQIIGRVVWAGRPLR